MKQLTQVEELAVCSAISDAGEIATNYFFSTLSRLKTIKCLDLSKNKISSV